MAEAARAQISRHLNEGMLSVIEQRKRGIGFSGEIAELSPGLFGAAITSHKLKRSIGVLSTRPPFRDKDEHSHLLDEDLHSSKKIAQHASGVIEAVIEIGEVVPLPLKRVVVSKTGALALWSGSVQEIPEDVYQVIAKIDGGNYFMSIDPYPVEIG